MEESNKKPAKIPNNCINYEYLDGYPYPESEISCRGCKHSADPSQIGAACELFKRSEQR